MTKHQAFKASPIVGYIVTAICVIHPGWSEKPWLSALTASIVLIVSGGIQLYHLVSHHTKQIVSKAKAEKFEQSSQVQSVIKTVAAGIVGVVALSHPGFTEGQISHVVVPTISAMIVMVIPFLTRVFNKKTAAIK